MKIALDNPIEHDGAQVTSITIRKPTFAEVVSGLASPVSNWSFDYQLAADWAVLLADVPEAVIDQLPSRKAMQVIEAAAIEVHNAPADDLKKAAAELVFGGGISPSEVERMTADKISFWLELAAERNKRNSERNQQGN